MITVSVCMITYNQEEYIQQAVEGVLMQQTNFLFELVVGNDKSTDRTTDILNEYASKYPTRIRLTNNTTNLGMMENFIQTLKRCEGDYIALCEGDDYWINPYKLQKQVDLLQTNDHVACFHPVKKVGFRDNITYDEHFCINKKIVSTKDLFDDWQIATCSFVFKNVIRNNGLPEWIKYANGGDYALQLFLSKFGTFVKVDEVMGVYRIHDSGVSKTFSSFDYIYNTIFTLYISNKECFKNQHKLEIETIVHNKFAPIIIDKSDLTRNDMMKLLSSKISIRNLLVMLLIKLKSKLKIG